MELAEIKKLLEEQGKTFEAFKAENDKRIADGSAYREETTEKLNAKLVEIEAKLAKSIETFEKKFNRPNGDDGNVEAKKRMEVFMNYLRTGDREAGKILNTMSSYEDAKGGYAVIPEIAAEITTKKFESSPIRQLANVLTISTDQYEKIQIQDEPGSGWRDREDSTSETTGLESIGKIVIVVHDIDAEPKVPVNLVNDNAYNLAAVLQAEVAKKFGRDEATACVTGDGKGQPRGFASYASGTSWGQIEQVASGNANVLTGDGLISLVYSLKDMYLANAVFGLKRSTLSAVRKLKDGNGNYLWQPSTVAGQPSTLHGYPVYAFADMATVAASALPVVFGDFKAGYIIAERAQISVLVDPYTAKGYYKYFFTQRVGGGVDDFDALKLQVISA